MSYILEALSKSEQARSRNAPVWQYSLAPVIDEDTPQGPRWPYALAVALVINAAVFYLWLRPTPPREVPQVAAPSAPRTLELPAENGARVLPSTPPATPADAVISTNLSEVSPPRVTPSPKLAANPSPARTVARVEISPKPTPKEPAKEVKPVHVATEKSSLKVASESSTKIDAVVQAKPSAPAPVDQRQQSGSGEIMPSSVQNELPPLTVAGFIHEDGSNGMVIVNDKLVREGDEVAPGLKLEKIANDKLVFNYKGYRFQR